VHDVPWSGSRPSASHLAQQGSASSSDYTEL
jgi:hypothetical protein